LRSETKPWRGSWSFLKNDMPPPWFEDDCCGVFCGLSVRIWKTD
jgi:hypothetical protein